jgi:hypothetical protein
MATYLKSDTTRITFGFVREAGKLRNVVVTLRKPNVIAFRAKGCRKEYVLTTDVCYWQAVKADRAAKDREKKRKKKKKR